jgi:hypothetical protein
MSVAQIEISIDLKVASVAQTEKFVPQRLKLMAQWVTPITKSDFVAQLVTSIDQRVNQQLGERKSEAHWVTFVGQRVSLRA